jgi:GT2 family glycosyltransferase
MKHVFISIINFNNAASTIECLNSLEKLVLKNIKLSVIVIDNASKYKFKIQNSKFKVGEVRVIRNEENLGFSGGHNVVIRYALKENADYVLILNNDTIVDRMLVEELLMEGEKNKEIGIVAPKIYFAKGFEFHKNRYRKDDLGKIIWYAGGITDWNNVINSHRGVDEVDTGQYEQLERTDFASGACMLIKREGIEKVGLLDEKYFLYYEDGDLCERIKRGGYTIIYNPKAYLWHKNAESAGGSGSNLQDYYITRNRMLFGYRYAPIRSKIALLKESGKLLISGREWQKKGITDFYLMKFGRGSFEI